MTQLANFPIKTIRFQMLEPLQRNRLSHSAIDAIKSYISGKQLKPGEKLPSERNIADQLKISRASVREALRILEIIGLIEVKSGSGIYFKGWEGDLSLPLGVWLPLNVETLRELFEVRLLIEPRSAALAAERADHHTLKELERCLREFQGHVHANDLPRMILMDREFHLLIAKATKNKTLSYLMNTISEYLTEGWKAALRISQRPEKSAVEHENIFLAIKNHDSLSASEAMFQHLKEASIDVNKFIRSGYPSSLENN